MPSASNEIVIDRPCDDVFAFLADPQNDRQWRSGILDLRRVSGDGIGARYVQGVKGPGGRWIAADIEITELTPSKTIAFHTIAGPARPRGRYELAAADGGTHLRFELEADMRGLKRLIAPMVQKTMNDEVARLAQLKHVLEAR
jgi:uncharacterized protein YndB with AHSA1/START domain